MLPPAGRKSDPSEVTAAATNATPQTQETPTASKLHLREVELSAAITVTSCSSELVTPTTLSEYVTSWPHLRPLERETIVFNKFKRNSVEESGPKPVRIGNRWAAPAMVTCAVIGLLWIVTFYTLVNTEHSIPFFTDLGAWNLVIGMGFILAAFGFAMKWE